MITFENIRDSLSPLDEAMLVRAHKGKIKHSKSMEQLVVLGLFDDLSSELTKEGTALAKKIIKEKEKLNLEPKPHVTFVLPKDIELPEIDDNFDDDFVDDDF